MRNIIDRAWKPRKNTETWKAEILAMPVFTDGGDADKHKEPKVVNVREKHSYVKAFQRYGFKCSVMKRDDGDYEVRRLS